MKLVRFGHRRTGLLVQLPTGLHVIDMVASLGAISPGDPISIGVLSGILKDGGSWAPLIEHWRFARAGLRRLAALATTSPDTSLLVIHRFDDINPGFSPGALTEVATLEIAERCDVSNEPPVRAARSEARLRPEDPEGRVVRFDIRRRSNRTPALA